MSAFVEYISSAVKNIRSNKLRTALTMLGIIIGIASVIAVLTIGDGLTAYVQNEMGGFSSNAAMLFLDASKTSEKFTPDDMELLKENIPEITGVTVDLDGFGVLSGKRASVDVSFDAGTADMEAYTANKVKRGHYFTKEEVESHAAVCVIPERDARKLTGTADAVGQTLEFTISGMSKELTIIGVKEDYSEAILTIMDGLDDYIAFMELPYTTYAEAFKVDADGFDQLVLFSGTGRVDDATKKAIRFLKNRHGIHEDDVIMSMSMSDVSDQVDTIMGSITMFMSFVAAISLLVGGIGVMNIMLVSVTERTREIGIRKSIGARTGAIMVQFLAEAAIISLLGGIVGIILGIAIAGVACSILGFTVSVDPAVVAMATVFSTLIGLFFGLHPARKAAKMRPIDALRY